MVTEPIIKTGFWRINPVTGGPERIESSFAPKKPKLKEEVIEIQDADIVPPPPPPPSLPAPGTPIEGIPTPDLGVAELADLFKVPAGRFVSPVQLADLALPPEERSTIWHIPYEQYLTGEQAKTLGFDVPQGSVIRMTPMAEGDPSFFLVPEPAKAPQLPAELESTLRSVYPEMFDPSRSFGFTAQEIPAMVVEQILLNMTQDFPGFYEDLEARVGEFEAERIVKEFGVTEENILLALEPARQEARITDTIQSVFPDFSLEEFGDLVENDFPEFIKELQTGGSSLEKRRLLEGIGFTPEEINQIFIRQRLEVPVDGVTRLLTIDIETQAAYDDVGNYVGSYNKATKEFTKASQESILKDAWDWTMFQSRTLWEQGENFMLSVLPNIIYPEMPKGFLGGLGEFMNETNRQMRENFRWVYGQNKAEYEEWVRHHPELLAPVSYQEGAYKNPELLKDPRYYVYELANIVPFIVTATAMAVATGGVGLPMVLGTAAIMAPIEGQAVFEDLINAGAPEGQAANMAAVAGVIIGLLEGAGRIPLLRQISPFIFGQFKKKALSELAKKGMFETIKKFGRNFTISQFSEITTEVAQEIISNVAVSVYDENRGILENLPDIAVKTAVATLLPSAFGAGVSVRMVRPSELDGLTDLARKAKGWIRDEKGNWFEAIKEIHRGEEGFVRLPGEPEEVRPEVTVEALREELDVVNSNITELQSKAAETEDRIKHQNLVRQQVPLARQRSAIGMKLRQARGVKGLPSYGVQLNPEGTSITEDIFGVPKGQSAAPLYLMNKDEIAEYNRLEALPNKERKPAQDAMIEVILEREGLLGRGQPSPVGEIPAAIPGEPEPGIQAAAFGVEEKIVRPVGKAKVVQISMDDQIKLDQARKATEEAPEGVQEAYKAQEEITGLQVSQETDPVAAKRISIGKDKKGRELFRGLDFFISIKEQRIPEYFTVKQAKMLYPALTESIYLQEGTPQFNRVPKDVAFDDLTKEFDMTPDEIAERIMAIRQEKRKIKELNVKIKAQMTETPLPAAPEQTTEEVAENWQVVGQPKLTLKQAEVLAGFMGEYVLSETALSAYELQRELRQETRSERIENFSVRAEELMVQEGLNTEEAMKQAIGETLAGKLPDVTTEFFQGMSSELRDALFTMVYRNKGLQQNRWDMVSTVTALTNAIGAPGEKGRAIPRERGKATGRGLFPEGGSAWDRLNFVFGKQPKVMKALDKIAREKKSLPRIIEGIFDEIGFDPIPVDQKTAEYLRNLSTIPFGYKTILEPKFDFPKVTDLRNPAEHEYALRKLQLGQDFAEGKLTQEQYTLEVLEARNELFPAPPITKYEEPIEVAFKEIPLWPVPVRENVVKVLKELGWLPIDIGNFLRANKASFDFSFWRQQAPLIASHPIAFAQANVEAWKAIWSQKSAEASWQRITQDPIYQIYEFAAEEGGDFLRPLILPKGTSQWRGTEEFGYITGERTLPNITGMLPWVKISARVFETGTNEHNWLIFKNYYKTMLRLSEQYSSGQKKLKAGEVFNIQKEMIDFSKSLANFTARGSLGRFQIAAPALSALFFAPRMSIGRILSVKDLVNANPRVRKEAWKNAALFVSTFGGIILMGAYAGWWDVERDPRSAEYMSIRIGNTRVDPWGGFRQFLVFFVRAFTGTGISSVTGAEYKPDKLGLVQNLLVGKASPFMSTVLDFWRGKNFIGEEVDVKNKKQWVERVAPFAVWDIYEAYIDDPTTALQVAIPAVVGAGVQTYTGDWAENFPKLGLPKYSDSLVYGITEPNYDTADFWSDTSSQFKGVDPDTLTKAKGFPPYIKAIAETRITREFLNTLPTDKLVNLNADPAEGTTFAQYRQMWADREKLVREGDEEKLKEFDQDERTRNAKRGNFSQVQFALLNDYWSITDKKKQAEFLKENKDEIGVKPRDEWLRSHPKENAELAVWGQAKIFSKEAFTEFNRLVKELDIPANALPELTMPPKQSWDTHVSYEEMVSEGNNTGVAADLLLVKDQIAAEEAGIESYADWKGLVLSDKSVEYLQMRVDHADLYAKLEEALDIPIKEERDAAVEAVRATKIDGETFHDVERRVDAMNNGTRAAPITQELVNAYVEHMRIVDETSGSSSEARLNRYDNPALDFYLMDKDLHGKQAADPLEPNKDYLDNWLVPRWRIDVKYREEDAEYDALATDDREGRDAYLAENEEYRFDRRRREALSMANTVTGERFPPEQIENFVSYHEIEIKGKRQERFLVANPLFAKAMHDIAGLDIPLAEDVPLIEYDNIYDEWKDDFEKLEGLSDNQSEFYIEDVTQREAARQVMKFTPDGVYTAFGLAEVKRNAYAKFVPAQHIETYVGYYKIIGEGKPRNWKLDTGTDLWYEDDWYLMENIEFYRDVYRDLQGNETKDFTQVPTREVFNQYLDYITLPHLKAKDDFRWDNREFDAWLVRKFDYTPITEKVRRADLTPYQRFLEEWAGRGRAIEERLKALRE